MLQVGPPRGPSTFTKVGKHQRIQQIRRVVDEFCKLDSEAVDAPSRCGVALRMLTILKSLGETTSFYEENTLHSMKRLALLGFDHADESAVQEIIRLTEELCDNRSFRAAFEALHSLRPRLLRRSLWTGIGMDRKVIEQTFGAGIGDITWTQIVEDVDTRMSDYVGDVTRLLLECAQERLGRMNLLRRNASKLFKVPAVDIVGRGQCDSIDKMLMEETFGIGIGDITWAQIVEEFDVRAVNYIGDLRCLLRDCAQEHLDRLQLIDASHANVCKAPDIHAHSRKSDGKERSRGEKIGRLRRQVEYYFSDKNLINDSFFRELIHESKDGWVDIKYVMACPIIQMRGSTAEDVIVSCATTAKLEVRKVPFVSIRRSGNAPLGSSCPSFYCQPHGGKESSNDKSKGRGHTTTRDNTMIRRKALPIVNDNVGKGSFGKGSSKGRCNVKGSADKGNGKCIMRKSNGKGKGNGKQHHFSESRNRHQEELPKPGMTVEKCGAADLTRLRQLWSMRGASRHLLEAWKVDNPLRTQVFKKKREQMKEIFKREADGIEAFHATHPDAIIPVCENGFSRSPRLDEAFGTGERFAKDPSILIQDCQDCRYMLVCRLTLGVESSTLSNVDGDHIWFAEKGFCIIKEPEQVLPQFIVKVSCGDCDYIPPNPCELLENILSQTKWSTKNEAEVKPVPRQRQCFMSNPYAHVLWLGFLHGHLSDESLEVDVRRFLTEHARGYVNGMKVQIVKGHFKKAHAILKTPIPKELVHKLNDLPFVESGKIRTICVDDGHGSPGQTCPKFIAGYCRGQNLRFTHPCWCSHPSRPTESAQYQLSSIALDSAKGVELSEQFMASGPFHNGIPRIVGIKAINNHILSKCHEQYRGYLTTKHMQEPVVQELYHGTNNLILDIIYTHGLQPPSDMQASELCPESGGKGLCTSLCNNDCKFCIEKHEWNQCHMFGLGIYLADSSQKSHSYVSQPQTDASGRRTYRMVVCSVLGKSFQLEGHLVSKDAMHDVVNVRALTDDLLDDMVNRCQACHSGSNDVAEIDCGNLEVPEHSDLLFVKGLGHGVRRILTDTLFDDVCNVKCSHTARLGVSVVKSEYVAFHPHQCLPKYEIEYELMSE